MSRLAAEMVEAWFDRGNQARARLRMAISHPALFDLDTEVDRAVAEITKSDAEVMRWMQ